MANNTAHDSSGRTAINNTGSDLDTDHPEWIDAHSVTCLICGGLADERCSREVWESQIGGAMEAENPEEVELLREIIDTLGQGEAHPNCFDYALDNGLEEAQESLDALTSRT